MPDLYDAYGRPIVYQALKEEAAAPTLAGIRNIFSVIDDSVGLTPEKAVGILRTAEFGDPWLYLELAERMEEKDLLYQGVLHTRKMAVSQLDIDVTAAGDDDQSVDDAEFIRDVLIDSNQIDLHDVVFEMLDALGKGFSATEILWDTDGRNQQTGAPEWLPFQLKWRDPRWFMFDWISGEQLLVRTLRTDGPQLPVGRDSWDSRLSPMNFRIRTGGLSFGHEIGIQPASQPLAPFKFITHVTRAKAGLPIRGGLARIAIWVYLFKNYVLKDWVTFSEVYGQPMRLGKYPPGSTEIDKAALLQAVANIGTDAAAIMPENMAIEFVESKGGGQHSHEMYEKFCAYLDKLLTIGILGQELTTQLPRGAGSRAAAQVHDVVRRDIATDDARRISSSLNRDLVKPLIDLNRGPRRQYPSITIGFKESEDLVNLMDSLGPAIDRGLEISTKWLREKFNAPDPEEGDRLMHPIERITSKPEGMASSSTSAISGTPLGPEFTDVDTLRSMVERTRRETMAGNPEAIGPKLKERGGSELFKSVVRNAVEALPLGAKRVLRNWTIILLAKASGDWVGLTDEDSEVIKIAEQRATGDVATDPSQVLRHEASHAIAASVKKSTPGWWKTWTKVSEGELAKNKDAVKAEGFEYMFKSPDEAWAEMLSWELPHPSDPADEHYAQLQNLLPESTKMMHFFTKPFGQAVAAAQAQKKRQESLDAGPKHASPLAWENY